MKSLTEKDEWLAIVNPNAGQGKGKKDWNKINLLLDKYKVPFKYVITEKKLHAIELTRNAIADGYRNIIAIGGDGTINEIVNGIFTQNFCAAKDVILGMITVGTGNDWGKMFGIPKDYEEAIKVIRRHKIFIHDIGYVTYYRGSEQGKRYFLNIAGLGFDAEVVRRTNSQKDRGRSGKAVYLLNLLKSLLAYRSTLTEVDIDGQKIKNATFTISLGIGRYSGGGMRQTPHAIPDDGLFDITLIRKMTKAEIIINLKKLYDGTILDHPKIDGYRGEFIKINSDPVIYVEADGESLGHTPVEFGILPKSINIIDGRNIIQ